MNLDNIISELKSTIEDVTYGNVKASDIDDDSNISNDLGVDSLDYAQTFFAMEEKLGIPQKDHDVDWISVKTVRDLALTLQRMCQESK